MYDLDKDIKRLVEIREKYQRGGCQMIDWDDIDALFLAIDMVVELKSELDGLKE